MSLFGTKKKHFVDTAVVRVIEDEDIPQPILEALLNATFNDKVSVTDALKTFLRNRSYRNFERMYRHAASGKYHLGLPDARVLSNTDGLEHGKAAIEAIEGRPVRLEYFHYAPLNNFHEGWKFLTNTWDYNHVTNRIGALEAYAPQFEFYLDKLVSVHHIAEGEVIDPDTGSSWENSITGFTPARGAQSLTTGIGAEDVFQQVRSGPNETESVEIHWVWVDAEGITQRGMQVIDLSGFDTREEYFQAKYWYTVGTKQVFRYWTYSPLEGRFPALDAVYDLQYTSPGTFFPIIPFRSRKKNLAGEDYQDTPEYKSSTDLLDHLGIDYGAMGDAINENPDIKDIRHVMAWMAVPITAQEPLQVEYLWKFFDALCDRLPSAALDRVHLDSDILKYLDKDGQLYAVEFQDDAFQAVLSFENINRGLVAGTIGPKGTYTNTLEEYEGKEVGYTNRIEKVTKYRRLFRYQVTPGAYWEIQIEQPRFSSRVKGDKWDDSLATEDSTLIPLDYLIARSFPLKEREDLYFKSFYLVASSHVVQKVKWYERGFFKALLIAVTVVITVYSFGLGSTWQAAVVAAGAGAATSAIIAIFLKMLLVDLIAAFAVQYALTELIELVGADIGLILAAVALVAGVGMRTLNIGPLMPYMTADNLLFAANGLIQASDTVVQTEMEAIMEEAEEFTEMAQTKMAELQELQKELESGIAINPMALVAREPFALFGETADNYFDRTVHSGNPGVKSLEIIQNFVDVSLKLPETYETLGNISYAV